MAGLLLSLTGCKPDADAWKRGCTDPGNIGPWVDCTSTEPTCEGDTVLVPHPDYQPWACYEPACEPLVIRNDMLVGSMIPFFEDPAAASCVIGQLQAGEPGTFTIEYAVGGIEGDPGTYRERWTINSRGDGSAVSDYAGFGHFDCGVNQPRRKSKVHELSPLPTGCGVESTAQELIDCLFGGAPGGRPSTGTLAFIGHELDLAPACEAP